ncbi:MAG: PspC domain-containing protein [Chitinophagales bacterium]|nr:PspC domain-containing protein [Bacteroidota bacterium]MCB9044195.1 PspC domain-containing protein [Chitinophagales bacterium]
MTTESYQSEKKILGVCAWLSDKFDIDVTIIRLIFVIAAVFGLGSPILIYFILALVK